jgi:uncharacterized protein Yka (UPF0111/DUF47 family)
LEIISVDSDAIDQLLIMYSALVRLLEKTWEYNGKVHQLFVDFEKNCDSLSREVLYNIFTEFGIPMKLG